MPTGLFEASGKAVGMAHYMRPDPANGVVEIGGIAHGPAMARSPVSTEAQYLLAKHIFEDLGYRRYEWKCHNENKPSKRTAERLGFTFEGVFRQHMLSKHANRDTAWFSIIDGEWPALAQSFERWLSAILRCPAFALHHSAVDSANDRGRWPPKTERLVFRFLNRRHGS